MRVPRGYAKATTRVVLASTWMFVMMTVLGVPPFHAMNQPKPPLGPVTLLLAVMGSDVVVVVFGTQPMCDADAIGTHG